jgi:hypothetical protein
VDAYVGDGVEPDLCSGLDGSIFGEIEAVEEILFDIADTGFDTRCRGATFQGSMAKPWWRAKSR